MKKIFTLLVISFAFFSLQSKAQLSCNPAFSYQFLSSSNVKFNPVVTDSPNVYHQWNFGDGYYAYNVSPTHIYSNGTYLVNHQIIRYLNGNYVCNTDTSMQIVIAQSAACNLANGNFYYTTDLVYPLKKQFFGFMQGYTSGDSIRWSFGDGTFAYDLNPIHTYTTPGIRTVCVRVKKQNTSASTPPCILEYCKLDTTYSSATNPCNLQAYFYTDSLGQNVFHFANYSGGYNSADSIRWTFGDGSSSNDVNPTHTYLNAGVYNVCLRIVKNSITNSTPCISEYCRVVNATATCNLVANFTSYRDSLATSPYTYYFTNTSLPFSSTDSIRWTFGDGTSSNQINPTHTYAQPGNYIVCVRIIKRTANGTLSNCVAEKCNTVTVPLQCNITAAYSYTAAAANYKTLLFTNTTAVAGTSYTAFWSFGDGTSATGWNTTHTYANAGTYTVCLTVQAGNCTNTKCSTVTITAPAPPCTQLASYTFVRSASNNNIVTFTPDYIDPTVQYTWTFGDGTGAVTPTSTHTFAAIGYYTACLTAYKNNTCASTVCKSVYVSSTANCSLNNVWFNTQVDSLVPNRITFLAQSPTAFLSQQWTIRKLPLSAANGTTNINSSNPTYVFLDSGYYRVCIKATFAGGCLKEYCSDIHVAQNMPFTTSCNLQLYPNPATNYVNANITLAQPQVLYAYVYNSLNVLVAQKQQQGFVGTNVVSMPTGSLPAGFYSYRLVHGNDVCTASFIK